VANVLNRVLVILHIFNLHFKQFFAPPVFHFYSDASIPYATIR